MKLCIPVAGFDAIFDWYLSMLGRFYYLHIVESTPYNQSCKRLGFFIAKPTFTFYFTFLIGFSYLSVNSIVKMTFSYFTLHAMNSQLEISIKYFIKTSYRYAKFKFLSVAYLYSSSII